MNNPQEENQLNIELPWGHHERRRRFGVPISDEL